MTLLSIIPNAPTSTAYIIGGILPLLLLASVWGIAKYPHKMSSDGILLILFLCLLNYLFPLGGTDFYAYKELVEHVGHVDINSISQYEFHDEKPYYAIINFVGGNYLLFRFIVWGGSLILFWKTARRLKLDRNTFVYYLGICIVQMTLVSRVSLAYAIAFYGFSFFAKPLRRMEVLSYIIGAIIIAVSLFFHRSAIFLLAVLPLSLANINKKLIMLLSLMILIVVIGISRVNLLDIVVNAGQEDASLLDTDTAIYYLGSDKERAVGLGQSIEFILKYGSHIAIFVLITRNIFNKSYNKWPDHVRKFANVTLIVTVFATALLLIPGMPTYKIFERLIAFAYVPQSFFLAYMLKMDYDRKWVKIFNLLMTGYVVYGALYYNFYFGIDNF